MKKIFYVITLIVTFVSASLQAQTFVERTHFEASAATGLRSNGITPVDFSFKCHVDIIPMLYLFVSAEDNLSLYKENGAKTYVNGASIGGGLGVKLLNSVKSNHSLDIRAKSLESIRNTDWKRTSYDVSLAWYIKTAKFSPVVELGYRFIDSRTEVFDNYGNAYISFGLRY